MSINKLYKHQSEPGAKGNSFDAPVDRSVQNFQQHFNGFKPSCSPQIVSADLERRRQEQFRQFDDKARKSGSEDIDSYYENGQLYVHSPTLSQSSNPESFSQAESREQTIGNMQITNLYESPRRRFARYGNEQEMELNDSKRLTIPSPSSFPRRAPGFSRRVLSPQQHENEESINESYQRIDHNDLNHIHEFSAEGSRDFEEHFTPQQQQQFQQHKLLEFQQRSKRQQVEKVLPLDDFVNFDSNAPTSSASYIGQRLVALKQIQQKQLYEHQLQQQYENRRIFEESCASEPTEFSLEVHENVIAEEDLDDHHYFSHNQPINFTLSPVTTDSNCEDLDSEYSLKYLSNDMVSLNEVESSQQYNNISMPVLEDGLSSEHGSDSENNNVELMNGMNNESQDYATKLSSVQDLLDNCRVQEDSTEAGSNDNNNIYNSKESISSANISDIKPKTEDDEADTDLETDRLLGEQRKLELEQARLKSSLRKVRCANGQIIISPKVYVQKTQTFIRQGVGTKSPELVEDTNDDRKNLTPQLHERTNSRSGKGMLEPDVLIDGVLFRARYLGTTQLVCEGRPTKSLRMMQAEEAVSRIKAPEGENQPSTEVDLFVSTEKVMVLNTDMKEMMMDHALKTISYIADIGDLVVLMARRRFIQSDSPSDADSNQSQSGNPNRTPKMICHIFESDEAQFIAQSIGQAFQVAYMEFLKANGIEDHSFMKEMDYQEVLNSQEIFGDELEIFAKKERQKEIVVPKAKGEILGVVIVESGWGSMLPTVVIANLASSGAAARCGHLNIGDQIIAINGLSLVGLPLTQCQTYVKNTKNQTAVKFTVVPCAPVVEVKIKRPNTKYQLGFSVQNGVICSLLRGGIAERGGVRVGHRIIEINNQSVVAVPHEKIVALLATSVGEILMKTMPTAMFRLLTGQENPIYI